MGDMTIAAYRLRAIARWMRDGAYYIDQSEQQQDIAACLAGARALEEADQCRLDQAAPQEVDGISCTACGYPLDPGTPDGGHNPNCPWLADARRDGTEGRQ